MSKTENVYDKAKYINWDTKEEVSQLEYVKHVISTMKLAGFTSYYATFILNTDTIQYLMDNGYSIVNMPNNDDHKAEIYWK